MFVEVQISYQLQININVLPSKFRLVKIFQKFSEKNSKTMHPTKKITGIKTLFFHILNLCTKFQILTKILKSLKER